MGDTMFFYDGAVLHIGNFEKILYVEEELIIVELSKYTLEIHGKNLLIIQLADDEMYIQGTVIEVDMRHEK